MRYLLRVRAVWTRRCSLSPIQSLETVLDRVHGRVYIKGFFHSPFLFVNSYIKKRITRKAKELLLFLISKSLK